MLDAIIYLIAGALLLLVPGFLFSAVLYPKPDGIDIWKRIGISAGLGIMLIIYVAYFLAKPNIRMLEALPFFTSVVGVCALLAIIAYFRGGLGLIPMYLRGLASIIGISGRRKTEAQATKPESQESAGGETQPAAG
ncbi:MAG: hypothetical protein QXG10_02670 [Candidatus Hadarchaeales archaeon]